ncbi:hypothetical protein Tco_1075727 [Tanacetum coccineum]
MGANVRNSMCSFSFVLKSGSPYIALREGSIPAMVLDYSCIMNHDFSLPLRGKVKDINVLQNLYTTLEEEGFPNVKLYYLGGLWVLIDLVSSVSKEKFGNHVGVRSWFDVLKPACNTFVCDERFVRVSVEGLPLKTWNQNTFVKIASK